ncbi:MAG TPA: TetR/AcrR family transcriptional regulator [Sandaracinaceae bacterium LLY-WYZ-13_1]|nr:TetR/AcrR family transcriptional regulator [Sandaracinaceae bacterium LLY-WYZ-13_1]
MRRKAPEATRAAILEAAFRAFCEQGYEATTVAQLLRESGLSKGAFYHHFESKEEVLDAVIERITEGALAQVTAQVDAAGEDALAQLECFVSASRRWRSENVPALRMLLPLVQRSDAAVLLDKLHRRALDATTPLLAGVLRRGVEDGVFDVPDPVETARQLLQLGQLVGRDQARDLQRGATKAILARADAYLLHVERVVGIDDGSLSRPSRHLVTKLTRALRSDA